MFVQCTCNLEIKFCLAYFDYANLIKDSCHGLLFELLSQNILVILRFCCGS